MDMNSIFVIDTKALICGLIAMITYGLAHGMSKEPLKATSSVNVTYFSHIFIALMMLAVLPLFPFQTASLKHILIAAVLSLICYKALLCFYRALGTGKIGIVTPIANSHIALTVLLSVMIFGESLNRYQTIGIITIIAGIFTISIDIKDLKNPGAHKLSKAILPALGANLLWGITYTFFKIPGDAIGPILTLLTFGIMITAASRIQLLASNKKPDHGGRRSLAYIFIISLLSTIGTIAYLIGVKTSSISLVNPLTFSCPLVSILFGRYMYKEKLCARQWIGAAIILAGIVTIFMR